MAEGREATLINEFLGSAHIFARAVAQIIEDQLWSEAAGHKLTVTQMRLLKLVDHPEGVHTIGDVATFLGISNAAASKAVDKLVRLMFMKRREGDSDRRAIHLSLTGPGRRLLDDYQRAAQIKLAETFDLIATDELQTAISLLDRLSLSIMNGRVMETDQICVQCGIYFRERCLLRNRSARKCLYLRGRANSAAESDEPK